MVYAASDGYAPKPKHFAAFEQAGRIAGLTRKPRRRHGSFPQVHEQVDNLMSMKTSDLNMLVALNALIEERSVTGATRRLHLSSPVMSRPLARLRETLNDPILVRAYRSMVPTPKALQMQEQVRGIVELAEGYFAQRQGFDLDRLSRTFK